MVGVDVEKWGGMGGGGAGDPKEKITTRCRKYFEDVNTGDSYRKQKHRKYKNKRYLKMIALARASVKVSSCCQQ